MKMLKRSAGHLRLLGMRPALFMGESFGANVGMTRGEVVFTTSLVGYPESLTDPSYRGQILVFTQPLIGNYGVPPMDRDQWGLLKYFESERIQVSGVVVADYARQYCHWQAIKSLGEWCREQGVPALTGIDTRHLTQLLRDHGTTHAELCCESGTERSIEPRENGIPVQRVSTDRVQIFNSGGRLKIALIDCGVKHNIIRSLIEAGDAEVHLVPFDYDVSTDDTFDGIFISNGPGDPQELKATIENTRRLLDQDRPVFGICMGNLVLGLATGAKTYKLKFGNRAHNQPVQDLLTEKCYITSQNHGYAVDETSIPPDSGFEPYFRNLNDGSNEGLRHRGKWIRSVQFHPEARGGPLDTMYLFEEFCQACDESRQKKLNQLALANQ